jgi:DNA-directed RNA polymerase subunit RPC12/RpoP
MVERMWRIPAESATTQLQVSGGKSHPISLDDMDEGSAEERAMLRRAARTRFRAYCIACGRSSESASAPPRLARCEHCGGTMLVEPITN